MTPLAILLVVLMASALLIVPRKWAMLPLLVGACYMTLGQGVQIGPFTFTVVRMLVAVGVVRCLARRERPVGGLIGLDQLMILWSLWACCSSAFHEPHAAALVFRFGMVYNIMGIYFLVRCFCQSVEDVIGLVKMTAVLLIPVAIEMMNEQLTGRNLFAVFGGVPDTPLIRDGRVRAQGPFAHSILAGTVGAVCVPAMIGIWRRHASVAKAGLAACLLMVVTSVSSGPIMSLVAGVFALVIWQWRHRVRLMLIAAVIGYVMLDLVMKVPAYYIIGRIDLTGSSSSWHRAALIEASINHIGEWWLVGTDFTRHWMPTGVSWSEEHTDITNYYLHMGVVGGVPLMLLLMAAMGIAFRYVAHAVRAMEAAPVEEQFMIWSLGAALFAHAVTCVSVSYWDQSYVFLYVSMGMVASFYVALRRRETESLVHDPADDRENAPE